ncbi:MAG: glycosyltransferase family 87 protein [Candidatus Limnocylindrales bacterium]
MTAGGPAAEVDGTAPAAPPASASAVDPSPVVRLARAALPIVALLVFIGGTAAIAWAARDTLGYDFQAYVHAANRLLAGQPLYDPAVDVAGGFAIFLYPPPFAVLMIPFTWLPAGIGATVWTVVLAGSFALGCALLPVRPSVRWTVLLLAGVCWPYLYSVKLGQVGPLLFLAFAAGWRWRDRPGPLGVAMAFGTIVKVQPALLFGWAVVTRRYRAAVIGIVVLAVAAVATTIVTGAGTWADYVAILGRVSAPVTTPHNFTLGALLYGAGVELGVATLVQWLGVVVTILVVLYAWWRADAVTSYVTTVVGSQLVSPLLWEHYAMLLLIPVALLLERGHWWAIALPLLPWLGPATYPPIMFIGLIAPILTAERRPRATAPTAQAPAGPGPTPGIPATPGMPATPGAPATRPG